MKLSELQKHTLKERKDIILKFQERYKSKEEKIQVLSNMSNNDIRFLIYCIDNIHGKIFYSKFLK